ncbi:hypothetical protein ACKVMT_09090 [Halobacteriales archaeon Cl-PHB]
MANGPTEPPSDGGRPEDGPILSPEELDIAEDDHVEQLDEDRFVVSPEARSDEAVPGQSKPDEPRTAPEPGHSPGPELSEASVHDWLRESFEGGASRYGFDVTATFDGSVSQRRMASNDVVTIFESLVVWYAQQIDTDTPVEEILGILLMESNVPVRYPPQSIQKLVAETELDPDDSIADLVAAVEDTDGIEL